MADTSTPLMGCYFRSWRDTANGVADNHNSMSHLPKEVDIAFVFPNGEETAQFWEKLGTELIPAMHAKGIKVVRTLFIDVLIDPQFTDSPEGHQRLADHVQAHYLSIPGLDGLDIDLEKHLSDAERNKAREVSRILGQRLKTEGKLFIYDTSEVGDMALLRALEPELDYVLFQAYGQSTTQVQQHYDRLFADFLPPSKFMLGFSFYEERGARWGDTVSLEASTARDFALWQPTQGRKAGIFSYAVDRDGVTEGDDALQATDYAWTRQLKHLMR